MKSVQPKTWARPFRCPLLKQTGVGSLCQCSNFFLTFKLCGRKYICCFSILHCQQTFLLATCRYGAKCTLVGSLTCGHWPVLPVTSSFHAIDHSFFVVVSRLHSHSASASMDTISQAGPVRTTQNRMERITSGPQHSNFDRYIIVVMHKISPLFWYVKVLYLQ